MNKIYIPVVLCVVGTFLEIWVVTYKKWTIDSKDEDRKSRNDFGNFLAFGLEQFGNILFSYLSSLVGFLLLYSNDTNRADDFILIWGYKLNIFIAYFLVGFFGSTIVDAFSKVFTTDFFTNFIKKKIE